MARILLINPSYHGSYGDAKTSLVNPVHPTLGLATIAASALEDGHIVEILDMSATLYDFDTVKNRVISFKPDIVGATATTPLMNQVRDISVLVKDISTEIRVVAGGPHPSALPFETMKEAKLDAVFVGEADWSFREYCSGTAPSEIKGIFFNDNGGGDPKFTGWRSLIGDLDSLPMPAWHLYDPEQYREMSKLYARRTPIAMTEFSRGCVFKCDFCASKVSMGLGYRKKTPKRCADEIEYLFSLGYREFKLADDIFTSDQKWAAAVSDEISNRNIDIIWSASNGIRVESADANLFGKMAKAGCYRVSFGFESGNDKVLKAFGKGGKASIEQGYKAVKLARAAKLDTTGFFLLGLSADTEETMNDTIEFARRLPLDILKFGITVGFPGTPMFNEAVRKGKLISYEWDDYFIYTEEPLFQHQTIDYATILKYMKYAYNRAIVLNPRFWAQRFIRGLRTGEIFWDMYYFFQYVFRSATSKTIYANYYAKDRWPKWNLAENPPAPAEYLVAGLSAEKAKKARKVA